MGCSTWCADFPAFVICFTILMLFWNAHYTYHRRYGLDDAFSRVLTMAILVLVLFFVYPLKFLFTMLTVGMFGLDMADAPHLDGDHQVRQLYMIYGLGFAGVWGLYATLYHHAWRKRAALGLDAGGAALHARIADRHVDLRGRLPAVDPAGAGHSSSWLPGFIYFLLGPLQALNGIWHGRKTQARSPHRPLHRSRARYTRFLVRALGVAALVREHAEPVGEPLAFLLLELLVVERRAHVAHLAVDRVDHARGAMHLAALALGVGETLLVEVARTCRHRSRCRIRPTGTR